MLGRHDGTYAFTIGQRKGLRLGHPAPDGKPRFVLDIEPVSGTVTVGPRDRLAVDRLARHQAALVRHRARASCPGPSSCARTATSTARSACCVDGETVEIELLDPAYGIAPGQAAVALRRHPRGRLGHHRGRRAMTRATGVGSHPGDDQHDYDEAVRLVLGELPDLPHLPEVPGRGAAAT